MGAGDLDFNRLAEEVRARVQHVHVEWGFGARADGVMGDAEAGVRQRGS